VTRSLTARTRVLASGAALLLTVGALAGCSGRPGQAADMTFTGLDGASHSIVVTEKDIDVVAKDMEPKPGQPTDQERKTPTRLDIAGALIEAPIIAEVAQAHGITVTDAEIVQLAKEQLGFEPRQAGGVIGWTAAIAAFGPFLFGVGVTLLGAVVFYWVGVVFALGGVVITWQRYARKGAPKPS